MLFSLRASSYDTVARALLPYTNAEESVDAQRHQSIDALIRSIDDEVSEEQNEHGIPHVFMWCVASGLIRHLLQHAPMLVAIVRAFISFHRAKVMVHLHTH